MLTDDLLAQHKLQTLLRLKWFATCASLVEQTPDAFGDVLSI